MRKLLTSFLLWTTLAWIAPATAQNLWSTTTFSSEFSQARLLVHAPQGVQAGQPLWLGLEIAHAPDWHSYWKNPGDSGLPTELQWQLSPGVEAGDIAWPTPRKFPLGELANYGYHGTVLLPVPMQVTPGFQGTQLEVKLTATWLICRQECVPEEARFQLSVPAQGATVTDARAFEAAWAAAPRATPAGDSRLSVDARGLHVRLAGLPAAWRGRALEFFPETPALVEPGGRWQQAWNGDTWTATLPLSGQRSASPDTIPLVVAPAQEGSAEPAGARLTVAVTGGWPALPAAPVAQTSGASDALNAALAENAARAAAPGTAPAGSGLGLWAALLGALVGGVILNLMPCVFPVLAIKVLAFTQHGEDHRGHRRSGLAYTAGVVLSFLALGGALLALRAAGEQLGWGFQLQNPAVVAGLAVLFTLIGLNLAGLFEFGHLLPSSLATLQAKNPTTDAFLTGILATAVASPCTAPFMGASLGLAIALPTAQALAVFAALGLGMALPYLAASWAPAIARALPRPGAWMETFRQLMAFPMFATVVWLLWVLGQQSGIDGVAALLMLLVALTWLIWALNRGGKVRTVLGTLAALAVATWLWTAGPHVLRVHEGTGNTTPTAVTGLAWEPWSPQREAELIAQGRRIFIDYTAAWCVTCQYNKRNALADAQFLQAVADRQVVLLRADWTRRDPAVTASLAQLGRNGVPVYVLHAPGKAPQLLSEVLSADEVRAAIQAL